jgi:hypothetical protein
MLDAADALHPNVLQQLHSQMFLQHNPGVRSSDVERRQLQNKQGYTKRYHTGRAAQTAVTQRPVQAAIKHKRALQTAILLSR